MTPEYASPVCAPISIEKGNKEAVIYFHGCSSSPGYFIPYIEEALACGYDVYAPLYSGHGTKVEDMLIYGYEDWLSDGRNAVEVLLPKYEKIHLLGHSLGGAMSIYTAGLYASTGKIGKVLAMCPGFGLGDKKLLKTDLEKMGERTFPFIRGVVYAPELSEYCWSYDRMHFKTLKDLAQFSPVCIEQIKIVTSPTWYMVAANDAICDVKQHIEIAKELPNLVDYHLFQKSGHNILNDCEYKDAMARVKMWLRA